MPGLELSFEIPSFETIDPKLIGVILLGLAAVHALLVLKNCLSAEPTIDARFSPKGGCVSALVAELATARREILVQAYSFTSPDIVQALVAAARRRVRVVILLDRSNENESYSALGEVVEHGLEVWIDGEHAIAHNKVMVIDGRTVVTGSFNFTRQAENENAENLLILRNHLDLAARYRANFHVHRGHSHAPGAGQPAAAHGHEYARR